ncbi:MAG: type II toxin-antitoxin system HicA family toxin [Rudaea sp.]
MPRLPHVSGAEIVRALQLLGFIVARQRGSHIVLRRGAIGCVVPNHREVKVGTLAGILKQAGLSPEELINALRS